MASIAITAFSMQMSSSSSHQVKKTKPQPKQSVLSFDTNKVTTINKQALTLNKEADNIASDSLASKSSSKNGEDDMDIGPRYLDPRWKNGTWDLNMFVEHGTIDWDGVIVSEAKRRKYLELFPQASTNQEPVLFRTSIIPLWAWLKRSHLPEAELLNGRAAMVGFFMSYLVDALTRLDMVGQTGNFICKAGLFMTVIGVLVFRRKEDLDNLRKLADEATFYDKQWQSSWKDHKASDEYKEKKI